MKCSKAHFLMKACVSALMKKKVYIVYFNLNQNTSEVMHGNCTCKASKKAVVSMLSLFSFKYLIKFSGN